MIGCDRHASAPVIRITITAEAFEAIARTLPLGSVGFERERTATGGYFIWPDSRTRRQAEGGAKAGARAFVGSVPPPTLARRRSARMSHSLNELPGNASKLALALR